MLLQIMSRSILGFLSYPIALYSLLAPRRKDLWCFGAYDGGRYADHSRMLFEEVINFYPEIQPFWSTRSSVVYDELTARGIPVVKSTTLRGMLWTLRAGVCFYTFYNRDHNMLGAYGARKIQLWHGIPLKKYAADSNLSPRGRGRISGTTIRRLSKVYRLLFPWNSCKWDYIIFQSETDQARTGSALRGRYKRGVVLGSIRSEWLKREQLNRAEVVSKSGETPIRVLYAPTHRKLGNSSLFDAVPVPSRGEFEKMLSNFNIEVEVRLHPLQSHESLPDGFSIPSVVIGEQEETKDIYHSLINCDVLITDYSSIFIDAVGAGIPVVCLAPDREEYRDNDHGFYTGISEFPGPVTDTWKDALKASYDLVVKHDKHYSDAFLRAKAFYFGDESYTWGSMERVVKKVLDVV